MDKFERKVDEFPLSELIGVKPTIGDIEEALPGSVDELRHEYTATPEDKRRDLYVIAEGGRIVANHALDEAMELLAEKDRKIAEQEQEKALLERKLANEIEARKAQEAITKDAYHDDLTGALTRRGLREMFPSFVPPSRTKPAPHQITTGIALIDLDHFKAVNDSKVPAAPDGKVGHAAGDEVLVSVFNNLREVMREGDILARWGGDEVVVLIRDYNDVDGIGVAQRYLTAIHGSNAWGVTGSMGIARIGAGLDLDENIEIVDRLAYESKGNGRNRASVLMTPRDPIEHSQSFKPPQHEVIHVSGPPVTNRLESNR